MLSPLRKHLPVLLAAVLASALTASAPVIAHGVDHALFAHDAGKLDGKDSNAFVQERGVIRITTGGGSWQHRIEGGSVGFIERNDGWALLEAEEGQTRNLTLTPNIPTALYGQDLVLTGVEICYHIASGPKVDRVEMYTFNHNEPPIVNGATFYADDTDLQEGDSGCKMYPLPDPERLGRSEGVGIDIDVAWEAGSSQFYLGRTTVFLRPAS